MPKSRPIDTLVALSPGRWAMLGASWILYLIANYIIPAMEHALCMASRRLCDAGYRLENAPPLWLFLGGHILPMNIQERMLPYLTGQPEETQ